MNEIKTPSTTEEQSFKWRGFLKLYLVLLLLFLVMFTMRSTVTLWQIFVPDVSLTFTIEESTAAILLTIYTISAATVSLIVGPIAERVGYKTMIYLGMFLFAVGTTISALSNKFFLIAFAQAIAGIGGGAFGSTTIAYAGGYFPDKKKVTAIGVIMSSFYVANIFLVPLSAYIGDLIGWRWAVGIIGGIAFIVCLLIFFLVPSLVKKSETDLQIETERLSQEETGEIAITEEIERTAREKREEIEVSSENRRNYLQEMRLVLGNKYALGTFSITLFQRGGVFAMTTLLSSWLAAEFGLGRTEAGLIFMGGGIASLISNTFFSWLADKMGKRMIIIFGTTLTAIWLGVFPVVSFNLGLAIASIILLNLFAGIPMGSYNTFVTEVVPKARATAVALNNTAGQISISTANAIIALIYTTSSYIFSGIAAMGMLIIAVILMIIIVKPRKTEKYNEAETLSSEVAISVEEGNQLKK